jgi:hypothetical protein
MPAGIMEIHAILTPIAAILNEFKLLLEQRVIWVGYLKTLLRTDRMRCS